MPANNCLLYVLTCEMSIDFKQEFVRSSILTQWKLVIIGSSGYPAVAEIYKSSSSLILNQSWKLWVLAAMILIDGDGYIQFGKIWFRT